MGSTNPTRSLLRLFAAVDATLEAVEKATTRPAPRDLNDAFLGAAYGRAFRCMRSIRELAGRGEADDALILARALVTIVARSLYIVEPEDAAERDRRLASWRLSWAKQALLTFDDLAATNFKPGGDRGRIARIAAMEEARGTKPLPGDRELLDALGLAPYYARVHRLASDVVHYSIGSALDGFVEYPDKLAGGGRIALKMPDAEGAEEVLALAAVTYGEFLEHSEPVIGHGVTQVARRAFVGYLNERAPNEGNDAP